MYFQSWCPATAGVVFALSISKYTMFGFDGAGPKTMRPALVGKFVGAMFVQFTPSGERHMFCAPPFSVRAYTTPVDVTTTSVEEAEVFMRLESEG